MQFAPALQTQVVQSAGEVQHDKRPASVDYISNIAKPYISELAMRQDISSEIHHHSKIERAISQETANGPGPSIMFEGTALKQMGFRSSRVEEYLGRPNLINAIALLKDRIPAWLGASEESAYQSLALYHPLDRNFANWVLFDPGHDLELAVGVTTGDLPTIIQFAYWKPGHRFHLEFNAQSRAIRMKAGPLFLNPDYAEKEVHYTPHGPELIDANSADDSSDSELTEFESDTETGDVINVAAQIEKSEKRKSKAIGKPASGKTAGSGTSKKTKPLKLPSVSAPVLSSGGNRPRRSGPGVGGNGPKRGTFREDRAFQ